MSMTVDQQDALQEVINIGAGRAVRELNKLLRTHISMHIPSVEILSPQEMPQTLQPLSTAQLTTVRLEFNGTFDGSAVLLFPSGAASKLVTVLTDEEPGTPDFEAVRAGTLSEVGNIAMNGVLGSMCNVLKQRLTFSPPVYTEDTMENLPVLSDPPSGSGIVFGKTSFTIASLQIEGCILLLFGMGLIDTLLTSIDAINA